MWRDNSNTRILQIGYLYVKKCTLFRKCSISEVVIFQHKLNTMRTSLQVMYTQNASEIEDEPLECIYSKMVRMHELAKNIYN